MDIHIISRSKHRKLLGDMTQQFARILKIAHRKVEVLVVFERGLRREGTMGSAVRIHPGLYLISIDAGLELDRKLVTIAHEMVHIKQGVLGQVRSAGSRNQHRVWCGRLYRRWDDFTAPWEREAYSRERLLVNEAINHLVDKPV